MIMAWKAYGILEEVINLKNSVFKNIIMTVIALTFLGMTNLVFNILIAKEFDAATLGSLNLVISTALLFSLIITTGFGSAVTKYLAEYLGKRDSNGARLSFQISFKFVFVLSALLFIFAVILSEPISNIIGVERKLFLFATPLIPLYAFYELYKNSYYGVNIVKKYLRNEIISDIIFFMILGVVVFYLRCWLILPFILLYLVFTMLSTADFFCYLKPVKVKQKGITKNIVAFASISFIGTFASMSRMRLSMVLSGVYVSAEHVGYYAAAYSFLTALYLIPRAMSLVIFPSFSYHYGKNDYRGITKILNQSTRWLSIIILLLGGIAVFLSKNILQLLFGSEYANASLTLQVLILSACASIVAIPAVNSLSGTKYVKIPNIAGVLGLISCLVLWPFLIPKYGIVGTSIGFLISTIVTSSIPMYYAWKYFNLDLKKFSQILLISFLILVVSLLIESALPFFPTFISTAVFVVVFCAVFRQDLSDIYKKMISVIHPK
jgi:O-antigen/teichoic acid export membrane protein